MWLLWLQWLLWLLWPLWLLSPMQLPLQLPPFPPSPSLSSSSKSISSERKWDKQVKTVKEASSDPNWRQLNQTEQICPLNSNSGRFCLKIRSGHSWSELKCQWNKWLSDLILCRKCMLRVCTCAVVFYIIIITYVMIKGP